jgi:hypothetical protein
MDLLSHSNTGYIENISYKAMVGGGVGEIVSLKVHAFLVVVQDVFFTKLVKTLFQSDETL